MAIVLKRLQDRLRSGRGDFGNFLLDSLELSGPSLLTRLNAEPVEVQHAVFTLLMEEEASLILEYNTLRAVVEKRLLDPTTDINDIRPWMYELRELSQILILLYERHINEHPTLRKAALLSQHALYNKWLESPALLTLPVMAPSKQDRTWQEWRTEWTSWSYTFITSDLPAEFTTQRMNPRRLYFLRERRLLLVLVPIIKDFGNYSSWIIWADSYVAPCLAYVGFLFFLPRLMFNLETLYTQLVVKSGNNALSFSTRFNAQWDRLWPNILNDAAWATTGLLLCFALVGSLQPLAIYFSVAMQFVDFILVSIRAYYEIARLNTLVRQYKSITPDVNGDYLSCLEKNIAREGWLLALACVNAFVLFCAICLTLAAAAAFHPLLPLLGSVIAVCMTVINFEGRDYFSVFKPIYVSRDFDNKLANALDSSSKNSSIQLIAANSVQSMGGVVHVEQLKTVSNSIDGLVYHKTSSSLPAQSSTAPDPQRARSSSCPPCFFSAPLNEELPVLERQSSDRVEFIRTKSMSESSPRGINNNFSRDSTPSDMYMNAELKASLASFPEAEAENIYSHMPPKYQRGITT